MCRSFLILSCMLLAVAGPAWGIQEDLSRDIDTSEFFMDEAKEIALARSAAPAGVSDRATIMVLRENGYEAVTNGNNGFVCLVLRSWGRPNYSEERTYVPEYRVPECFDRNAAEIILPMQLLRAQLGVHRTDPKEINQAVRRDFRLGQFRRTTTVSFSYMLSNEMMYRKDYPGDPHIMVYIPDDYSNELVGGLSPETGVLFVEGGLDSPYTAAVIRQAGIDPVYPKD